MTAPRSFWPAVAIGWASITVGVVGVLGEGRDVPVAAFGRWVLGLAVLHDVVVVPIVLAAGVVIARVLRPPWRAAVSAALVVAGPVVLFAWPFVAGWGRSASNPSIQPRSYGSGLVTVLAVVAVVFVVAGLAAGRRARRRWPWSL